MYMHDFPCQIASIIIKIKSESVVQAGLHSSSYSIHYRPSRQLEKLMRGWRPKSGQKLTLWEKYKPSEIIFKWTQLPHLLVVIRHFESYIVRAFPLPRSKTQHLQLFVQLPNYEIQTKRTREYNLKKFWIETSENKATWTVGGNFNYTSDSQHLAFVFVVCFNLTLSCINVLSSLNTCFHLIQLSRQYATF